MASLDDLITKLEKNSTVYTPLTQGEMQQQAENRYKSTYDQKKLGAQQAWETSDQALAQQLAGLQATYDKQRQQSAENYRQTYSQADRQALSRGMQRSSYNNATLANINLKGAEAQQAINATQAAQEKNIGQQRPLLTQQLAQQMRQYNESQQADILAYLDELEAREYDRGVDSKNIQNQLAMQLYEYQFQKEEADREQSRWEAEFNAKYGGGGSGGGGSGGGKKQTSNSPSLWDMLGGSNKSTAVKAAGLGALATAGTGLAALLNRNKK